MQVTHFKSASEFRKWLETHHASTSELWVGFYKRESGKVGLTYAEVLDEALCFGWIDGIRKRIDEATHIIRFTPRKAKSIWSLVNLCRANQLRALGRMTEAGLKALAARDPRRTGVYSFEQPAGLSADAESKFKASQRAWTFFQAQPHGYRRVASHWVMSAKREATRVSRLQRLIAASASQSRLAVIAGKRERKPA